jgi:HD-like signal output (HDOD) protein
MGKIVFSETTPNILGKVKSFCADRTIPETTLEDVAAGMNHAEIGAKIAEKWNFPEVIISAIRFHHDPAAAPERFVDIVHAVYLANMMCLIEQGQVILDQLDLSVLAGFGISNKKQIEIIVKKFSTGFAQKR